MDPNNEITPPTGIYFQTPFPTAPPFPSAPPISPDASFYSSSNSLISPPPFGIQTPQNLYTIVDPPVVIMPDNSTSNSFDFNTVILSNFIFPFQNPIPKNWKKKKKKKKNKN